jgi:CheY-like chemotaxis protein
VHAAGNMARAERGLPVQITKDMGDLPAIKADRGKLTQAVTAILHFLARGGSDGSIQITTRHTASHLVLTADNQHLVLTETEHKRAARAFGGADGGPSLGVASEIIRRHGGELDVRCAVGTGTRVTVRIPETTGLNVRRRRSRGRNLTRPTGSSLKLLVIDHEQAQIDVYRRLLEPSHQLTTALSGSEALARLDEDAQYDAILVALTMPGIDGRDFFDRVSVKHPGMEERIVFCASTPDGARLRGLSNPQVAKPPQRGALLAALLEASGKPSLRRS